MSKQEKIQPNEFMTNIPELEDSLEWKTQNDLLNILREFEHDRYVKFLLGKSSFIDTKEYASEKNLQTIFHGCDDFSSIIDEELRTYDRNEELLIDGPWYKNQVPVFLSNSLITAGGFSSHEGAIFELKPEVLSNQNTYEINPDTVFEIFNLSHQQKFIEAENKYFLSRKKFAKFIPGIRKEYHNYAHVLLNHESIRTILLPVDSVSTLTKLEFLKEKGLDNIPIKLFSANILHFFSYILDEKRKYQQGGIIPTYVVNSSIDLRTKEKRLLDFLKEEKMQYLSSTRNIKFL